MKFIGRTEAAIFLRDHPERSEVIQAWVAEMQYRTWTSAEDLATDFANVDVSDPPRAVFDIDEASVRIETLVDFKNRVVLLTSIRQRAASLELFSLHEWKSVT